MSLSNNFCIKITQDNIRIEKPSFSGDTLPLLSILD